ncbi:MAG: phage protein Gp27 family protein [Acidobacteriota bacterium]
MARPSSIDKLPEQIRAAIMRLREQGCTIDEILAHLADLHTQVTISRSALGRHVKGLDAAVERMKRSRVVAEALARELGDDPGTKAARVNIEFLHGAFMDLFTHLEDGEARIETDPENLMFLAKGLDHLARAQKTSVDTIIAAEKRGEEKARRAAAEAVEKVAKAQGLTADTVKTIKAEIFGVAG